MAITSTGLLVVQLNSLVTPSHLSRIVSAAIKKIEKNLYIKVQICNNDHHHENNVQYFNRLTDEMYSVSSNINGQLDTRIILSDLRDSLLNRKEAQNSVHTNHKIQLILSNAGSSSIFNQFSNQSDNVVIEELAIDEASIPGKDNLINLQYLSNEKVIENQAPPNNCYENVVLGGTFDRLHAGHKMLLSAAILRCKKRLTVGVTDGAMVNNKKLWEIIEPCELRMKNLKDFLVDVEPRLEYCIVPITDPYGPTAYDPDLEVILIQFFKNT